MIQSTGSLLHKTPSVGSLTKKLLTVNPDLSTKEIIDIIKASISVQSQQAGEFAGIEVLNEARAIELAQISKRD